MAMEYTPVRSTAIAQVGYDPDIKRLEVEFVSGQSYTFDSVPPEVAEGLVASASPGRFFQSSIKGVY